MSWRYKGGFIQEFFNPLTAGPATDFSLFSFGQNFFGQLGQNDRVNRSSPVQVGSNITWNTLSAGYSFAIATTINGSLWSIGGQNNNGQLGQNDRVYRSSPVQVGALTNWSIVESGYQTTLALKTDGTLWGWGKNTSGGTIGDGTILNRSSPVQIGSLSTWLTISCGEYVSAAIKTDGTLWTWGNNPNGELGQGNTISKSSPVQVGLLTTWSQVSAGPCLFAIKTDGTLWSWGFNAHGQLGQNNVIYRSSPVQVGALTTWSKVSSSTYLAMVIKTDGTLWSWGYGDTGALGQNNIIRYSSPVQVGSLANWSCVSAADYFVTAAKTDGTLWSWGMNNQGQLGQNDKIYRSSPTQIGSLSTWSASDNKLANGSDSSFAIQGS